MYVLISEIYSDVMTRLNSCTHAHGKENWFLEVAPILNQHNNQLDGKWVDEWSAPLMFGQFFIFVVVFTSILMQHIQKKNIFFFLICFFLKSKLSSFGILLIIFV